MQELMRKIKKTEKLAALPALAPLYQRHSQAYIMNLVKMGIAALREELRQGRIQEEGELDAFVSAYVLEQEASQGKARHQRVLNCTGTVLHTNLGRAILSPRAGKALEALSHSYSNLELNLETGKRGSRYDHVTDLLCRLTGAEDAIVVNNNAAAVLLILTSLCQGKEAIVSRGELVEIGGSFRVPKVMDFGGAILREVGTTNKTHLEDYQEALGKESGLLVKVHRSNYVISGFTKSVSPEELAPVARKARVPLYYDLGSGALLDLQDYGIQEPSVRQLLEAGVDLVSFSGDKLLGGPQGGIIAGKKKLLAKIRKNQLLRALRVDKLTLTALEATLMEYLDPEQALLENPTLRMLTISPDELREKGEALLKTFQEEGLGDLPLRLEKIRSLSGGGSLPEKSFPSWALVLKQWPGGPGMGSLGEDLRCHSLPVIVRIREGDLILDLRTIREEEYKELAEAFSAVLGRAF